MIRVGASGVVATIVDVIAMVMLVEFDLLPVGLAAFTSASAGAVTSFLISKFWAFRDSSPIDSKQVTTYAMVALVTAILVAVSVHCLYELAHVQYLLAKAVAAVGAFLFWGYPAQSRIVFRHARMRRSAA